MKQILSILALLVCLSSHGQKVVGQYQDHFGQALILNPDSSFEFTWHLDLEGSWNKGKWSLYKDTLTLSTALLYDTLRTSLLSGQTHDSLVVSKDHKADVITTLYPGYITTGWQNRIPPPLKLYYNRNRLYRVLNSGSLDKTKQEEFWTHKKYQTWFKKTVSL
jgi:hypothetical protein